MDELDTFILKTPLNDGWIATGIHEVQRDQPHRCRTYHARHPSGQEGFVKVLPPSTQDLALMRRHLDEFFAEKEIVELCAERNMRRVVRALAFSAFIVPGIVPVTIHYLIFEWAAHDVRSMILDSDDAQTRAALSCLHHMATALHELHFSKIAHQNLRPASVLRFDDATHKLGDFRHASRVGDMRGDVGSTIDPAYAPPELLYGRAVGSFDDRYAVDLYQLGSLALFLLTGMGATVQLARRLADLHHWRSWEGSFDDILPYLTVAHDELIQATDGPGINRTTWEVTFATKLAPGGRRFCREEEAVFSRTDHQYFEASGPWDPDF